MKKLLQRILKFLAYTAAGIVILLAIAVGLFRLFLPRLPEYQEDIKGWTSAAIGMRVEFSGMDARWGLRGPEVEFYDAELLTADAMARIVRADVVSVGVGLMRLLVDRKLVVDRVIVRNTDIEVRQLDDGQWHIQGNALDELMPERRPRAPGGVFQIIGEDIVVNFLQPGAERPLALRITRADVSRDAQRLAIDANVMLPPELGGRATVYANRDRRENGGTARWDVNAAVDDVSLPGISALELPIDVMFSEGDGHVDVSIALVDGAVETAAAVVDFRNIRVADEPGFSVTGVFEYERNSEGFLVASDEFVLETANGRWPAASLRVEVGTAEEGAVEMLDLQASFLRLDDFRLLMPWLNAEQQDRIEVYDAEGEIRDLAVMLGGLGSDSLRYDVAAELSGVGFAAVDNRPGVRDFSGHLRADGSGGRLEINAPGMALTVPRFLGQTAYLSEASGTLIWRRSDNRTTLLSDSIVLRTDDLAIEANVEVSLLDDSRAPIVDLAANWSVSDLATAKRYIPMIARIPNTSRWFQEGILAGRIPRGSARLYGPMDKFPFDGGEGRLYIEANVRDAAIKYLRRWPAAEIIDLDIAVENMRLFSERNHVLSAGNEVFNAKFELSDFRQPVVSLQMGSRGELDAVRSLLAQSPLGTEVFGGTLDDVSLSGAGSFDLDLSVPIRDTDALTFTARLETSDASFALDGFPAPVTDLSGVVTVQKDDIGSEDLKGTFLGRPVAMQLAPAPDSMPAYRIVAAATGTATADGLIDELGVPLKERLDGEAAYAARLLFPRGGDQEEKAPFAIEIESKLEGLAIELPRPLAKTAPTTLPIAARIEFPARVDRIVSRGTASGLLTWAIDFAKPEGAWDLERGVVRFGDGGMPALVEDTETRGLHLRGSTDYVRFDDWLALADEKAGEAGIADRIRSIDARIGSLHILGQHLVEHQVRVDRSAFDWLVQVEGSEVAGSVIVPYDFRSGRELVLDMERLVLPGDETVSGDDREEIDPRSLPPISVRAGEFAVGGRHLGELEARFRHTADGLESDSILTRDETFSVEAAGGWVIDESDPLGYRSYVRASLKSKNVERTMERLNYDPGIVADDLSMVLDMSWSGGPDEDFLESLDGEVDVRIGTGQLDEVDPGAGRMFGLLSIVALPRRLSLDFRDVFGKGFGFDRISGTFRIEDGQTYTCDLSLEGPAANIGIVGRAGLVTEDYEQAAVVSANFGNTLPVVGGVLGGPQVAAVMLVFSQLFKKPLQEATEIYYGIDGTWTEPVIDRVSAEIFAETASSVDCITESQ